jgi:hypothetical protein
MRQNPFDMGTAAKLVWSHTPDIVRRTVRGFRHALAR